MHLYVRKKIDGDLPFTDEAIKELKEVESTLVEMLDLTILCLSEPNAGAIERMVVLENQLDNMAEEFQENHIRRLNKGTCNVDAGVLFIDMIGHLERIGDHVYKITMMTKDELFGKKREI